jgi:SLBB domain
MNNFARLCKTFMLLWCFASLNLNAQITELPVNLNAQSNYFYIARPSDFTMKVSILGEVKSPGLYEIKEGLLLNEAIGLSGGPQLTPRQMQDTRTIHIRLSRQMESGRVIIYDETLDNYLSAVEAYPVLKTGDIVYIESSLKLGFSRRDALTVGSIATGILAILANLLN